VGDGPGGPRSLRQAPTRDRPALASRRQAVIALLGVSFVGLEAGCATNPETGRSQLLLVSDADLSAMAATAWAETKAKTPVSHDPALGARLVEVGGRIKIAAGRGGEPWEYAVFDTGEKNAFVLPGGRVGCHRGLMEFCDNDSQLAAVLGHETGHVTAHHAAERASQSEVAQLGLAVGGAATRNSQVLGQIFGLGVQYGVLLPYGRLQESEADRLGVDYMYRAGYDVREAVTLWRKMAAAGGARQPEFLSTHPSPENRIVDIRAYINARGYAQV
jgi:predicted Zn-dependent protease